MTRLIEDWIRTIRGSMKEYDYELMSKTGRSLRELASAASEVSIDKIMMAAQNSKVGVIPFTAGLGIIGSFAESVSAIAQGLEFEAFVTSGSDVDGIYEAHQKGANILFMADDHRFIAINLKTGAVAENSKATAMGYVEALRALSRGLMNKKVLVLGCGTVGQEALRILKNQGAIPVAYDKNTELLMDLTDQGYQSISDPGQIAGFPLILDATSEGGWLHQDMLHPEVFIVTPGVPLSLDPEAFERHKDQVIHDCLPIGVATMLALVCK